jgi:hypothetical protein
MWFHLRDIYTARCIVKGVDPHTQPKYSELGVGKNCEISPKLVNHPQPPWLCLTRVELHSIICHYEFI